MEATPEMIAMARRITAETCEDPAWGPEIIAGKRDDWHAFRSALAAIIETTELAAAYLSTIEPDEEAAGGPASWADFVQIAQASFRAGHHYGKDEG